MDTKKSKIEVLMAIYQSEIHKTKKPMLRIFAQLLMLLLFCMQAFSKDYHFDKISPNAGFAFNELNTIVQDEYGAIWFGSTNGLYKYNSQTIERFSISKGNESPFLSNNVTKLYIDDDNLLWICTSKGFCSFNKKTIDFDLLELTHRDFSNESPVVAQNILQANDSIYFLIVKNRLYKYNRNTGKTDLQFIDNQTTPFRCKSMVKDHLGSIWIGGLQGSVIRADSTLSSFKLHCKHSSTPVTTFCIDNHFVWIGYDNGGVDKILSDGRLVKHYGKEMPQPNRIVSDRVRKIIKRENGDIWVATFLGINILSDSGIELIVSDQFNNLPNNSIYELSVDRQGGIWIGTWAGGLAYYSDYNYHFKHIKKIPFDSNLSKNNISSFAEDRDGTIWIASENAGLKTYNQKNQRFETVDLFNKDGDQIRAKCLTIDKNERIWLGTFDDGIWYKNKNQRNFRQSNNEVLKSLTIVHNILESDEGLWFASHLRGAVLYDPKTDRAKKYNMNPNDPLGIKSNQIWNIVEDSTNNIWIATNEGVCIKRPNSESFSLLSPNDKSYQNIVYTICDIDRNEIWAGTKDNGILKIDKKTLSIHHLDLEWNNSYPEVYNLIRDDAGHIWINSDQGIQMYDPKTGALHFFDESDGVLGKNFNPNACLKASTGELYFGGSYGFNVIHPNTIIQNPFEPQAFLSDLKINNKPYSEMDLKTSIGYLPDLKNLSLKFSQNTLSVSFVANNYVKSSNNKFKYRLTNYQDEWVNMGTKTEVNFTKIPPGKYELEVLAANNNGLWSKKPYVLHISIIPPFWLTYYAYALYFMVLGLIAYLLVRESHYRAEMQKTLLVERFRHDSEEKLFQEKQKFFTNISHEFRTPLTLILSPINILNEHLKDEAFATEHLTIIKRNADRLLRLTNEILDFRLIETGRIKLKKEAADIIAVCKNAYDCFGYAAIEKEINFIFSSKFESLDLNIDANKIEKIIYNLLSNAFKFSSDKSQIILSIDSVHLEKKDYQGVFYTGVDFVGDCLEIKVKDFGRGIETEDIMDIFERFSSKNELLTAGTGLGLHISQEYIRLHGGNIIVNSVVNKETTFIVNLPLAEPIEVEKQNILLQPNFDNFSNTKKNDQTIIEESGKKSSEIVVLLIEDHMDLRKYLKNILSNQFKVLTASNGTQGYEIALEIVPSLIISDVMMPGMDGFSLTKKIKQHKKTSHIPIILLTALNETASEIDGIAHGADSYLVKPVDEKLLFAHINRHIDDRKKIQQQMVLNQNSPGNLKSKAPDKLNFIEKIEVLILDNLQNPNFSVEELAEKLNLSRSSLHRKLKKDSNQSVTEFIREIRIKKAIDLMKTKKYNLDEIGVFIGYNSHSYFTRSFKKIYGQTPKEFYDDLKSKS